MLSPLNESELINYRPFSRKLLDVMRVDKSLENFRAQIAVNDDTYLSHLVLIDANLEFSAKNALIQSQQMENFLIELQELLLAGVKYEISKKLLDLTKQLLFKTIAEFLLILDSEESIDLVPLVSSLSYQAVDCLSFNAQDSDIAAWSALMTLDSLTLFLSSYKHMNKECWDTSEIGDRIIKALFSKGDGKIRLRSDIFQEARDKARELMPAIPRELPEKLADLLLSIMENEKVLLLCVMAIRRSANADIDFDTFRFFQRFVYKLSLTPGEECFNSFDYNNFTSADFAVFLEFLTQWSIICQPKAKITARINFTPEQIKHWKSICLLITNPKELSIEDQLHISTVIRTVRMHKNLRNIKLLFGIFTFLRDNRFPKEWTLAYAKSISKHMLEFVENPKDHLFRLRWENSINFDDSTSNEDDQILQEVQQYLMKIYKKSGETCSEDVEEKIDVQTEEEITQVKPDSEEEISQEKPDSEDYLTEESIISKEFSEEEEERFLMELVVQKLKVTQQMFAIFKGELCSNKESDIKQEPVDVDTSESIPLEERYKKALEDLEKLKLELERERFKKNINYSPSMLCSLR